MITFNIQPVSLRLKEQLQDKINRKTKPLGSLGKLETLALKIGLIQDTLSPVLTSPAIVVFAADHGIVEEGVSAYPQDVTYQMVMNFLNGGAAINIFCRQNGLDMKVVDAGVRHVFEPHPQLIDAKVAPGTQNFASTKAMSLEQCETAISRGADIVSGLHQKGCNIIGFGEMGIGNTSSASVLMSLFCNIPLEECVGRGTGIDDERLRHKRNVLKRSVDNHDVDCDYPLDVLSTFGGFEIAMMCGAMLRAAEQRMIVLVDGFIATSAFLSAYQINKSVLDYALFCHQSDEPGHKSMLDFFELSPLLDLNMRLGEGTGAAVAYPLVQSAVAFLNDMASFESAGVSSQEKRSVS